MQVTPLQDRVLVKRLEEETKTSGGIIIPDTHKEKPVRGEIVSVGSGYRNPQDGTLRPLEVKKGDKVIFGKYAGTEVKFDNNEYLIMKEEDILGIIQ
ncbi:MAG: co-chaperone GroES [Bacteriovoracaceae bacterium]|nr:co-chaperone GroES [Bacteriovoracaceae bacterium]